MKIGYARVSKADGSQVLDLQMDALKAAGVAPEDIYTDNASGKLDDRPGLAVCLRHLRAGDVLITWRLDRLGRDLRHLLDIVADLDKRGVGLQTLTGVQVDTTSATGKLIFTVFAALAEYERAQLAERTKAGLMAARARGRLGGRPKAMTKAKLKLAQTAMRSKDTDATALAKELGVSRTTLYRHVTPEGELRPDGEKLMRATEAPYSREKANADRPLPPCQNAKEPGEGTPGAGEPRRSGRSEEVGSGKIQPRGSDCAERFSLQDKTGLDLRTPTT